MSSTEQTVELVAEIVESNSTSVVKPLETTVEPETEAIDVEALVNDIMNLEPDARKKAEAIDAKLELESEFVEEEDPLEAVAEKSPKLVSSSVDMIKGMISHLSSDDFVEQCEKLGEKHQLPPKVIAKNFCLRLIGMIGDCLDVAINVTRNFVKATIDLLIGILKGGIDIICDVAEGLVRVVTLNQTARAQA